ncbi:element excision factor XisH family protein [Candidatus Parabeggiatoa sp. HSG14]|uniref:element excision factor XisH family protein n=1 Tax=Candidatus Parabeggiatoa sp. HSG14 TaxID=3055593 RepID=UPI0032E4B119
MINARLDTYHHTVKRALDKDGWTITHDPFLLRIGRKKLYADLGASCLVSAEKKHKKIVVEIKSFMGPSEMRELEQAVGQYVVYQQVIEKKTQDYTVYLAITSKTYDSIFTDELGLLLLKNQIIRLVVFDAEKEVITQWIPD